LMIFFRWIFYGSVLLVTVFAGIHISNGLNNHPSTDKPLQKNESAPLTSPLQERDLCIDRLCEKPTATKQSIGPGSPRRVAARDDVRDRLSGDLLEDSRLMQRSLQEQGPVALIRTVPLKHARIEETFKAYGTVIPLQDEMQTFSVSFECVIEQVLVNNGQVIQPNEALLKILPSPDTQLKLEQAKNELTTAKLGLKLTQERLKLKLATQQALVVARQRLQLAQGNVQSMKRRGINGLRIISATSPGIVFLVNVQQGQVVPAGASMLQTTGQDQVIVQLNIESEDIDYLKPGQSVRLKPVHSSASRSIEGHVLTITRKVDPLTRLVSVLVQPVQTQGLLLNDYIEGEIVITSRETLVALRRAVLPEDGKYKIFTVKNGHAVKHIAGIGLENSDEVEILSDDLREGDLVVVMGNHELINGMAVQVEAQK
jgi:membrane fusion protein, multidrug efflux system